MSAEQRGKERYISKSESGWAEAHWQFDFTVSLPPIFTTITVYVPDSIHQSQRYDAAVIRLKNLTKAIAKKVEVTF